MSALAPIIRNRIPSLDVLRGVAILGILLANIGAFTLPIADHEMGIYLPVEGMGEVWNDLLFALVVGKFRGMLAILFGAGLWLQFARRSKITGSWPGGYLKRTFWLTVLGLVHGVLIWYGDILFLYSFLAFVCAFLVNLNRNQMLGVIGCFAGFSLLCGGTFPFMLMNEEFRAGKLFLDEAKIYSSGSYLEQLSLRGKYFAHSILPTVLIACFLLPLFLVGILLARTGTLAQPSSRPKIRNACLIIGLGVGLPLNLLSLFVDQGMFYILWEFWFGPILALGYVILGAIAVERGVLKAISKVLQKVGRVALSVYILQSLICTTLFYSWGFELYGKLDANQLLMVVLGVWLACAIFAMAWLSRFDIGPVEWVWRSLTEGKSLPWTRERLTALDEPMKAPEVQAPVFQI